MKRALPSILLSKKMDSQKKHFPAILKISTFQFMFTLIRFQSVNIIFATVMLARLALAQSQDFPSSLEIVNPNPVGSGARALGQGNAFIAVADDATAASWNPAGLTQLQRPEFSIAYEFIDRRDKTNLNSKVSDSLNVDEINYASFVLPFNSKRRVVFSLNYLRLYRFDKELELPFSFTKVEDDDSLTTFTGIYDFDQEGSFSVVAPSLAVAVSAKLSLGITFNLWSDSLTGASSLKKSEITTVSLANSDGSQFNFSPLVEINRFEVEEGNSVVFGGMVRFGRSWTVAGVIKPPYDLNLKQERVTTSTIKRNSELEFPWIIGLGAAWRPSDEFTFSADVTWTDWSEYIFKENGISTNPITGGSEELDDTFTLRIGCEYIFVFDDILLPIQGGAGYDPAPAVNKVDEFYTINFGIGVQFLERFNIDLAYEFRWGNNVGSDALRSFNTSQDIQRHRLLASSIYYF